MTFFLQHAEVRLILRKADDLQALRLHASASYGRISCKSTDREQVSRFTQLLIICLNTGDL